ncbi:hypothetical protein PoB_003038700 [Plakobranchus ocellatus]|uniref:Mutator-like transposase domain-containing protein n=1 Tax=Plakobranchus ocellatus TaxID=259542 RepID=A0AAV4AAI6_9GAST|nr:hypothetical protein PoB_003038700 [Plakobranchus ocellatus]
MRTRPGILPTSLHAQQNHKTTSSGTMKVEASRVMWGRSMARNLRYTTLISDGDSKTHNELLRVDPYPGTEVVKEECTNHVAERFGSGCRNIVAAESKSSQVTLGGRKVGALTQQKVGLLQAHYKRAVVSKCTSTAELRKKILSTLKHRSSSDDNP